VAASIDLNHRLAHALDQFRVRNPIAFFRVVRDFRGSLYFFTTTEDPEYTEEGEKPETADFRSSLSERRRLPGHWVGVLASASPYEIFLCLLAPFCGKSN